MIQVRYGKRLVSYLKTRDRNEAAKIYNFAKQLEKAGFLNLEGRNKSSDNVPYDDPRFLEKVKKAQENKWWHYHIGIHTYDESKSFGNKTSEFILHYSRLNEPEIRFAKLDRHPPFNIPNRRYLKL